MNAIQQARQLGQSIWLDYIRRGLLDSGELAEMVKQGVTGVTANPATMENAILGSTDYDAALNEAVSQGLDPETIYEEMAIEDMRAVADLLRPVYDRSSAADGYPCLEISPLVAYDTGATFDEAKRLFTALGRPNVMVKVPATPHGIPAIRRLVSEGVNVNVTLIFSLDVYEEVKEAYLAGLEDLVSKGGNPAKVCSVASFFLSRIDSSVDTLIEERIKQGKPEMRNLLGVTAISTARLAYASFEATLQSERFAALKSKGAQPQRLLWASTSTKNPAYKELMYVESLIGPNTICTMPQATLKAFLSQGVVKPKLTAGLQGAKSVVDELEAAGVNLRVISEHLLEDGVKHFSESFKGLLEGIEEKKKRLAGSETLQLHSELGKCREQVEAAVARMDQSALVQRIWQKDHTVWKPDPKEITNRLGWLNVTEVMRDQVVAIRAFAEDVRRANFRHVVLLGMGGSSLGAEVLCKVFNVPPGRFIVLDSTIPAAVQAVTKAIDPERTLFILASKSGTTIEPQLLFEYFRDILAQGKSAARLGSNFVAITDPGTPLVRMAEGERFRKVFINQPDIGGRYSILSSFGLVPAALAGIDIVTLLERADRMREGCASCVDEISNPGAWLGACIGSLALNGRDKLTLITSPVMSSFGLWAEQLVAESTGKEGKGIIPVAAEPMLAPEDYTNDRLFVYLRLKGDKNDSTDSAAKALMRAGQPVIVLDMADKYDLGAEFFRWELSTAVAGALLGINPFDQPDVQKSKTVTVKLLHDFSTTGHMPDNSDSGSLAELLSKADRGKYLAIMAFLRQTPDVDKAFNALRKEVAETYGMATTLGYGPRFLHSTGQLHKGGPDNGLFLQIVAEHEKDVPIPEKPYTFGVLADAQAAGDFQALQAAGRSVVRIRLPKAEARGISSLMAEVEQSV